MENNNNTNVSSQSSFWQFSDQLRNHTNNLANLSSNDSIWSVNNWNNSTNRLPEDRRRNFDIRVGGNLKTTNNTYPQINNTSPYTTNIIPPPCTDNNDFKQKSPAVSTDINKFNNAAPADFGSFVNNNNSGFDWKIGSGLGSGSSIGLEKNIVPGLVNGGFNKGIYNYQSKSPVGNQFYANNNNTNNQLINSNLNNLNLKAQQQQQQQQQQPYYKNFHLKNEFIERSQIHGQQQQHVGIVGIGKKKNNNSNNNNNKKEKEDQSKGTTTVDKRFKTLPPAEALPKNEMIGGYIFVCNNDTMEENLRRQLFGLPPRYRDSVRAITPGLPLFLYNYSTHQLHGIYEAASFGASNIDPTAWEDKKNPGESRFPAQVKVQTRKICDPLEEDSFRPILHHYDGPKFRLELTVPEALSLLDIFADLGF